MADIGFLVFEDKQGPYRLVGDEAKGEEVQRVDMSQEEATAFIQAQYLRTHPEVDEEDV